MGRGLLTGQALTCGCSTSRGAAWLPSSRSGTPPNTPHGQRTEAGSCLCRFAGVGRGIYQKDSNLAGQEELLYESPEQKTLPIWSPDGKRLLYGSFSTDGTSNDLWVLPSSGSAAERKPLPFVRTEFYEGYGRFSPDGHWVAYQSNQSGKQEIYVLPFDGAGGLWQVSKDGGSNVHWSRAGKELVYLGPEGYLMAVDVSAAGPVFQSGTAQQLFKLPAGSDWDISADGQRFLIAVPAASDGGSASSPIHVVTNWTGLLKR